MPTQHGRILIVVSMLAIAGVALALTGAVAADEDDNESDEEPHFEILDVETNAPVTAGETMRTEITVENTGNETGTQSVSFWLDQHKKDEATVELGPGESTTVELSYVTKEGDEGEWTHTAETADDVSQKRVVIEDPDDSGSGAGSGGSTGGTTAEAVFEIQSVSVNDPIKEDEELVVEVEVENTGDADEDKRVWIDLEDATVNGTTVSLRAGETKTVEIIHDEPMDAEEISTLTVVTPDDRTEMEVEIEPLVAIYEIESVETNAPVDAGDVLNVTVELSNSGDVAAAQEIALVMDGITMDTTTVEFGVNETETVTLTYHSTSHSYGEWDATVETLDDAESMTLTVEEPATRTPVATEETSDDTATPTASDDAAEDPDDDGESVAEAPGFGVAAALVALLGAALLARRRLG